MATEVTADEQKVLDLLSEIQAAGSKLPDQHDFEHEQFESKVGALADWAYARIAYRTLYPDSVRNYKPKERS
jgi:hypothetical protein